MVLMNTDTMQWIASLGHFKWAFLSWPLIKSGAAGGHVTLEFDPNGEVSWQHILDPAKWITMDWSAFRSPRGIVLQQVGATMPLVKGFLLKHQLELDEDDLRRLVQHFGISGVSEGARREGLLNALASYMSGGDPDYVQAVMSVQLGTYWRVLGIRRDG